MGKYYCYRHIRPDIDEPFYIGIGTKPNNFGTCLTKEYSRAYSRDFSKRTQYWRNIYLLNSGDIEVDILFESDDYQTIKDKEREFIALYGRKDLNKGILINLTDGGEGQFGVIRSEYTKQLLRESLSTTRKNFTMKGKNQPQSFLDKMCKPVLQYDKDGDFMHRYPSITDASRKVKGAYVASIIGCLKNKRKSAGGFFWKYE